MSNFSAISWKEQVYFQWDDDEVCFVLDQHAFGREFHISCKTCVQTYCIYLTIKYVKKIKDINRYYQRHTFFSRNMSLWICWKSPCHAFTSPSWSLRERSSLPIFCRCGGPWFAFNFVRCFIICDNLLYYVLIDSCIDFVVVIHVLILYFCSMSLYWK